MKKSLSVILIIVSAVILIAWGRVGHQTVAMIAEHHLTPHTREAIKAYLGGQSLVDVSNWADEVKNQPSYKYTAPLHYLDLPAGLNHEQFIEAVDNQDQLTVYGGIIKNMADIKLQSLPMERRVEALKFLIHFVGDAHQPMHISRAEDKGGNNIQVQFDGRGTNLHSVWDSKLIDHQRLSYAQLAKEYDTATPEQIKQWQKDGIAQWLWESYQISSKLYKEAAINNKLDDAYYNEHIGIIKQRIDMAGIRLAGILNQIFDDTNLKLEIRNVKLTPPPPIRNEGSESIPFSQLKDAKNLIGQKARFSGKVYSVKNLGSITLANIGNDYPNQLLTVVLRGETKSFAEQIVGKTISVTGTVINYKGRPEIEPMNSRDLTIAQ